MPNPTPGTGIETVEHWAEIWNREQIPWQEDAANKYLLKNIQFLTDGKPNQRILVPFCGKTLDMLWLAEHGHTVIGVELVEKAILDFFNENKIPFTKEAINVGPNSGHVYTGFDGKLTIFECDYFILNSSIAGGKVDGIWDCHALGAVSPEKRKKYLEASLELLQDPPQGRILYQAFHYKSEKVKGPPFSIPLEDLGDLFGDLFELQLFDSEAQSEQARLAFKASFMNKITVGIKYKS